MSFHSALQKYTNNTKEYTFEAENYFEMIRACISVFPDLENMLKSFLDGKNRHEELTLIVNNKILSVEEVWFKVKASAKIVLCPIIYGSDSKILMIGAIVALVAIAIFAPYIAVALTQAGLGTGAAIGGAGMGFTVGGATAALAATIASKAIGLAVSLALNMMSPSPKIQTAGKADTGDGGPRRNNDAFGGLVNTTTTGVPLALHYGHSRVGGQFISGYLKTIDHQKNDVISVSNYT